MSFRSNIFDVNYSAAFVVTFVVGVAEHQPVLNFVVFILGALDFVYAILNMRRRVIYHDDTSSFDTDESRRQYERPESRQSVDIAPNMNNWPVGVVADDNHCGVCSQCLIGENCLFEDEADVIYMMSGYSHKPIVAYYECCGGHVEREGHAPLCKTRYDED